MINKKRVDLHLHSNMSDGLFKPAELMEIIAKNGLSAAALTDHDTIDGLAEAQYTAVKHGIEFVPGVEISIIEKNREIHLLGYFPEKLDQLDETLLRMKEERYRRMKKMISSINRMGINISLTEVLNEAGKAAPGRLHLARIFLNKKYVHNLEEVFSLYLNPGRPAYAARSTLTVKETMNFLQNIKAVPVIAHPGSFGKTIISELVSYGLKGIEVFHPDHGSALQKLYLKMAGELNLLITGGSDFHGDRFNGNQYPVHRAISYDYLENLKTCLQ